MSAFINPSNIRTGTKETIIERPAIALDKQVSQDLHSLVIQSVEAFSKVISGNTIELEFRLGKPRALNKRDRVWLFDPSSDQTTFERLRNELDKSLHKTHKFSTVSTKDIDNNTRLRLIEEDQVIIQKKTTLQKPVDQIMITKALNAGIGLNERSVYMTRFALSSEEDQIVDKSNLQKLYQLYQQSNAPIKTRKRERWSYQLDKFGTFDLTLVDGKEYSIEFEYSKALLASLVKNSSLKEIRKLFVEYILPPLKYLSRILWPSLETIVGFNDITERYFRLMDISSGNRHLHELQPQNIAENEVEKLLDGYAFTNKLNGKRYQLILSRFSNISEPAACLISNTDIKFITILNPELAKLLNLDFDKDERGSLVNVEFWIPSKHKNNKFNENTKEQLHAFDCLVFRGQNKTTYPHENRFNGFPADQLNYAFNQVGYTFEIKPFFYTPNDPIQDLTNVIRYMYTRFGIDIELDNDGLIQQPIGTGKDGRPKAYYDRKWPIYKWKWPSTVSIDFRIEEIEPIVKNNIKYRVFTLLVSDDRKLVPFKPFRRNDRFYNPPAVFMIDAIDPNASQLKSGIIVELGFDRPSNSFVLLTIRDDKTEPNVRYPTAEATFVDMYTEFSLERFRLLLEQAMNKLKPQISGQVNIPNKNIKLVAQPSIINERTKAPAHCLENYRSYHNRIKTGLIQLFEQNKTVLDLGAGRGGDLWKEWHAKTAFIWAVEPNDDFVNGPDGFNDRLSKVSNTSPEAAKWAENVQVIQTGAQNTRIIRETMESSKELGLVSNDTADVVSSFFSASFFFQDEAMLKAVARTIGESLAIGGRFIGTMMDGEKLFNELKNGNINESCYSIRREYDSSIKDIGLGLKVVINLDTATVQGEQTEWISPFDALRKALSNYNIDLVETFFFDDAKIFPKFPKPNEKDIDTEILYNKLNVYEKRLNNLYRYFVFEKREISKKEVVKQLEKDRVANHLKILGVDDSEEINIPLYSEPLYRVGTIGDGSCAFHSLLFLLINETYLGLKPKQRMEYVKKVRIALADALSPEIFKTLAGGSIETVGYLPFVESELKKALIDNIKSEGEIPDINEKQLENIIQTAANAGNDVSSQISVLINELSSLGYDQDIIRNIIEEGRLRLWKQYQTNLKDCKSYTDHDTMEYVMRTLKRNIFIIEDTTRQPVLFAKCDLYDPELPSLVILLLNQSQHYEAITGIETDDNGNVVNTTFTWPWDSPFIQSLYSYVCGNENTNHV